LFVELVLAPTTVNCQPVMDTLEELWWISDDFDQKKLALISGVAPQPRFTQIR
jgi:hypothetical protein